MSGGEGKGVNGGNKLAMVLALWGFAGQLEVEEEDIKYETQRETHIWTVNEDYILKMTDTEDEIANNVYISTLLSKAGIPAQRVVCCLEGSSYAKVGDKFYGLFTKIKGEVLKDYFTGNYVGRGFYLGQCIAELHQGLKKVTHELTEKNKIWVNNMLDELSGWVDKEIDSYLPECNLSVREKESFNKIRIEFSENFKKLYPKLPRQVIHRDAHGGNMIFKDDKLAGYIDFDLSQINAKIFDVCYLCTGALAGVFDEGKKRGKWLNFTEALIRGYDSKCKITIEEKMSMKYMFYAIELIMTAFFARGGYKEIADSNIKMVNWIGSVWDMDI